MNTEPIEQKDVPDAENTESASQDSQECTKATVVGPGVRLREAREELGLNRVRVGEQLGLTQAAVKNLEKNHFEPFPNSVYVRGYLKNYAKTLGQSETEIIEIYDRFCEANNLDSGKNTPAPLPEKPGSDSPAKALIGLVVVGILAMAVSFFVGWI